MKKTQLILLILIAAAVGVIISMVSSSSTYETFATAQAASGEQFHVVGELDESRPLYYEPERDPNFFSFYMTDKTGNLSKVIYKGAKPRDFERSEQIVLVGQMDENGEAFHAAKILMKCPSKYVDEELVTAEAKVDY